PWFAPTLLAEGRLAGRIEHQNVIPIYALGKSDQGAPILVMKRMRGTTWEALLRDPNEPVWERFVRDEGRLDYLEHNLAILLAVVQGISAAHRVGVLHRDLKPANVLVAGPDEICIIDWGLALDLRDPKGGAHLVGTPAFMAPEQLRGRTRDVRVDVYAVGATLYECLTGSLPFRGSPIEILLAKQEPEVPDPAKLVPSIPAAMRELCMQLMAVEPEDRPISEVMLTAFGDVAGPASSHGEGSLAVRRPRRGSVPFVGREPQLALLQGAFEDVGARAEAVTVHVHGASGYGKSALINKFLADVR
ncbi:MAG: serine/threonine-protein kinase PknK, partial [Myxococcales bacterium]|nr:serine/threonine-protein kinase PknK [Myxococcales bacterium]